MPEVASVDLIGHVIKLCGISFGDSEHANCCHDNTGYPPKATSYFHNLVHGRKLVGKVREMLPEASRKVIEESKCKGGSSLIQLYRHCVIAQVKCHTSKTL